MLQKQIYLFKISKRNALIIILTISCLFMINIIFSHKVFAFACGTTGNPGDFLKGYDSVGFGSNNCGNSPDTLHWGISGASSFDSSSNTYSTTVGNTLHISLGYYSAEGTVGRDTYTWMQFFDPNGIVSDSSGFNTNSANGLHYNHCFDMALPDGPYQNAQNWPTRGQGGKIGCNGDIICYDWVPAGVDCSQAYGNSSGAIGYPNPPGANSFRIGHSVVYHAAAGSVGGDHSYTLDITPQYPGTFCFREHVSVSPNVFSSDSNFVAGYDLAPDLVAMYDGQPGSGGNACITVNPVASQTQATCSFVAIENPSPEYQELVHVQGWAYGATGSINSPGTVEIPSSGSTPRTDNSSRVTTGYNGDGPQSANMPGRMRNSYDWGGTQLFVINHNDTIPGEYQYTITYEFVEITLIQRHHDPDTGVWTTTSYKDTLQACEGGDKGGSSQVTCTLSVTGDDPLHMGRVIEDGVNGGTVYVKATITNGGDYDLPQNIAGYLLQFNNGNYNNTDNGDFGSFSQYGPPGDGPIYAHSSRDIFFNLTVSPTLQPKVYHLVGHPAYSGDFQFGPGSDCATDVNVYAPFTLTPNGSAPNLSPSPEAPTDVSNSTWVSETGATVSETVTGYVSKNTANCGGAIIVNSKSINGTYFNGNTFPVYDKYSYKACQPTTVGDNYCDETNVPVWKGFVDVNNNIINTGGPKEYSACSQVENRPTFKVYGGGVEAGGAFSDGSGAPCTSSNTGTLAGWNNNTGVYPPLNDFGSGTSLNSIASGKISGFASSQLPPTDTAYGDTANSSKFTVTPYYLSFANQPPTSPWNVSQSTDIATPDIGGNFGQSYCLYNPVPNSKGTGVFIHTGNYTITNGDSIFGGTGRVKQGALMQVSNGGDPSKGNVYINSDIIYNPGPWTVGNVPSFILRADGNIYISKDVQELDGIYVSLHGHIYTCGNSDYTNKTPDQLWGNCNKQLSVYGSFIANQIDLERTFGTLRNETPVISGAPIVIGSDTPKALNEFECEPVKGTSQYQRPHFYQVPGSSDPANSFAATLGPDSSSCKNAVARGNDGYIFSANDTYFYNYLVSQGALGSFNLLCEKKHFVSGAINDNQLIPIAASGGVAICQSSGGRPLGYVFTSSAGNLGGAIIQPLYSNLDSNCYSNFNFNYYSITDNGEPIHNTCDSTPTNIGYVFKSNFVSIPINGSGYTANHALVCDNNGNNSGSPSIYKTCAAETFYYDPEMYLTNPALQLPSNGTLEVDSIATLPPVL